MSPKRLDILGLRVVVLFDSGIASAQLGWIYPGAAWLMRDRGGFWGFRSIPTGVRTKR